MRRKNQLLKWRDHIRQLGAIAATRLLTSEESTRLDALRLNVRTLHEEGDAALWHFRQTQILKGLARQEVNAILKAKDASARAKVMFNVKCDSCGLWHERKRPTKTPLCSACQRNVKSRRQKQSRAALRSEVLQAYGGKCQCCGQDEEGFLSIEHMGHRGIGNKHRREVGGGGNRTYNDLKKRGFPKGYTVLCYSCNLAKNILGECPHVTKRRRRETLAALDAALTEAEGVPNPNPASDIISSPEVPAALIFVRNMELGTLA